MTEAEPTRAAARDDYARAVEDANRRWKSTAEAIDAEFAPRLASGDGDQSPAALHSQYLRQRDRERRSWQADLSAAADVYKTRTGEKKLPGVGWTPDAPDPLPVPGQRSAAPQAARPQSRDIKRRGWVWLVVIGSVTAIIGIFVGFQKAGGLCGSVFKPDSLAAELYDSMGGYGGAAECRRNIASAAVPTWVLIVMGIVLVLTGIIVRTIGNSQPPVTAVVPAGPSIATQIEDLARLREQGLISAEEFDAKRTGLLARL